MPAIFGAWAGPVADAAGIRAGDKVLDVGCGTGVLAREASAGSGRKVRSLALISMRGCWRSRRELRRTSRGDRALRPRFLHEGSIRFPSVKGFIRVEVKGSPLAGMLSDDAMQALAAESENALADFVVASGEIVMPMDANIVTASKG